jgi:hypothetical protein
MFEQYVTGNLDEIETRIQQGIIAVKGEFVV